MVCPTSMVATKARCEDFFVIYIQNKVLTLRRNFIYNLTNIGQ